MIYLQTLAGFVMLVLGGDLVVRGAVAAAHLTPKPSSPARRGSEMVVHGRVSIGRIGKFRRNI